MEATGGARRKTHAGGPWVAGSVVAAAAAAATAGLALAFMLGDSGSRSAALY